MANHSERTTKDRIVTSTPLVESDWPSEGNCDATETRARRRARAERARSSTHQVTQLESRATLAAPRQGLAPGKVYGETDVLDAMRRDPRGGYRDELHDAGDNYVRRRVARGHADEVTVGSFKQRPGAASGPSWTTTRSTTVNIAVIAPLPVASMAMARSAVAGRHLMHRPAYGRSWRRPSTPR